MSMLNSDWATSARRSRRGSSVTVREREIQPFSWAMELLVRQVQVQIRTNNPNQANPNQIKLSFIAHKIQNQHKFPGKFLSPCFTAPLRHRSANKNEGGHPRAMVFRQMTGTRWVFLKNSKKQNPQKPKQSRLYP